MVDRVFLFTLIASLGWADHFFSNVTNPGVIGTSESLFSLEDWNNWFDSLPSVQDSPSSYCLKKSTVRALGTLPKTCPLGKVYESAMCYERCRSGYVGVATICWESCAKGMSDVGLFCVPKTHWGDTSDCPLYDKCGLGGADRGCVSCEEGFSATGCLCENQVAHAKDSYSRGVGSLASCPSGKENFLGLCYPPCEDGYTAEGTVCWENCPETHPLSCGGFCTDSMSNCLTEIEDIGKGVLDILYVVVKCFMDSDDCDVSGMVDDLNKIIEDFSVPKCEASTLVTMKSA